MNKGELHVVMPIGVSIPTTPVLKYLKESIESLKGQTYKNIHITVASDNDVQEDRIKFLEESGVEIQYFPPNSFFKTIGIWGKLFECWERRNSEYIAFMHYDDLWDKERVEKQVSHIESDNLNGSFAEVHVIDSNGDITAGDQSTRSIEGKILYHQPSTAFCHSLLLKREQFLNTGIRNFDAEWSWKRNFESVITHHVCKMGNVRKTNGAVFYYRSHPENISNSINDMIKFNEENGR